VIERGSEKLFQRLDWDSKFFGYAVAKITKSHLTSRKLKRLLELLAVDFRLAYWFVDTDDKVSNSAARENDGFLADEKTTYIKKVPSYFKSGVLNRNIRPYLHKSPSKKLVSLALQAGVYSRFKADSNFVNNEFEIVYSEWLKNSLKGTLAKEVFVYVQDGVEIGFITVGEKNGRGDIGLIAVDKEFRGQSIGRQLVEVAFAKAYKWGYSEMQVVTQRANIGACKFYEKLGFAIESIVKIYHFWLDG